MHSKRSSPLLKRSLRVAAPSSLKSRLRSSRGSLLLHGPRPVSLLKKQRLPRVV